MPYQSVRILLFVIGSVALIGCAGKTIKDPANTSDVTCVKRADLQLVAAALKRDVGSMENALRSGADANATVEGLGPPMVISALTDNSTGVQLLLDKGANINATDAEGYSALMTAAFSNHKGIAQLLVSRGVDVNLPHELLINGKRTKFTPLSIARARGHQDIVKLLTEAGAKD